MRRAARAALAVAPAIAVVLLAGAPGAMASHTSPHKSTPATHQAAPPPPPPLTATNGMPRTFAGCQSKPAQAASSLPSGVPWAQQALGFSSVWPITRGQGVTVAVVDSGVQYTPQLNGRVSYKDLTGTGGADCVGHGTAVASIIAASDEQSSGVPFYGVAPAARILSIKITTSENVNPGVLAAGIRDAVNLGAQVINVSSQVVQDTPALHQAINYALGHNRVVVAAAGNDEQTSNGSQIRGPFYPAAYPGVLSVGAVDQDQEVTDFTPTKTPISVTAPGQNVQSDYPGGFSEQDNGTSFAAPFVSGEAALIRAAFPRMSAASVVARIIETADGHFGDYSGAGLINPAAAITGLLPQSASASGSPHPVSIPPVPHGNAVTRLVAVSVTCGGIAVAILVVIVAMTVPHGRRRSWRPSKVDVRALGAKPDETGSVWGDDLPTTDQQIPARGPGPTAEAGPRSLTPG
jgi:membrane-anchored mycosin MYCP